MFLSGNLLESRKDYWLFPKNSALDLGTYLFCLQRYLYLPYKLRGTYNTKLGCVFCVCFKDMVVERNKKNLENLSQLVTLLS